MRTIAIVNQKGGCGKTTVSINLASVLAEQGQKTLLVDMDPQSHCAVGLAVPENQIEQSIYDVLISNSRGEPIRINEVLWQISDRLELAPASIDLSAFEQQMQNINKRECCLRDVLTDVYEQYDYVVVDCPPAVGLLTFNALRAATDVIVPVETGYFSLHGLSKQLDTLDILCQRCNQQLNVKVLASMYDIRTKMAREILGQLRKHFGDKMFRTTVNFNTKIKEASSYGQPVNEYDPNSKGRNDFDTLAKEILGAQKTRSSELVNSLSDRLEKFSATADELLKGSSAPKTAKKTALDISQHHPKQTQVDKVAQTTAKLADYYGANQLDGAIVFVTLYPDADNVQIAGDFNNWQPRKSQMKKVGDTGVWQTKMNLPAGKYRYRLVVDGKWQQDPYNGKAEMNPFGDYNSVIEVD